MSAVATKKRNGDFGVQVTFPAVFQREFDGGVGFFPCGDSAPLDLLVGSDFQATYHEEKKRDANKSVMDGLQARRTMEQKLLTGHQNFHLPKPVLGQRRFANPMNGVTGFSSARRDHSDAPFSVVETGMRGGVVSTAEGQDFYRLALQRRIDQLNRMNALAQGFAVPMGQRVTTFSNEKVGEPNKVKFFLYLRGLVDAMVDGKLDRFSFENVKELLDFLFKFAPTATIEDFEDTIDGWDEALEMSRALPVGEARTTPKEDAFLESVSIYLEKGKDYLEQMFKGVDMNPKDRQTLSKSLIRSLGFGKLMRRTPEEDVKQEAKTDTRVRDSFENFDGAFGGDGPDDDGDGDGRFDRPAEAREDGEQRGVTRGAFAGRNADPNRERYGNRNGQIVHGSAAFFGETTGDEETQLVAPLPLAGMDPAAQVPTAPTGPLKTAVMEELTTQLRNRGWDGRGDPQSWVDANVEDTEELIGAMEESLLEKQFTKPQIAAGMEALEMDLFGEYVSTNKGSLAAEPIQQTAPRLNIPFAAEQELLGITQQQRQPPPRRAIPAGLPKDRSELNKIRTYEDFTRIGALLGYRPRRDSQRKNMVQRVITLMRQQYNPDF